MEIGAPQDYAPPASLPIARRGVQPLSGVRPPGPRPPGAPDLPP